MSIYVCMPMCVYDNCTLYGFDAPMDPYGILSYTCNALSTQQSSLHVAAIAVEREVGGPTRKQLVSYALGI